jgi:hypothetical protein
MKCFALALAVVVTASLAGCVTPAGIAKTRAASDFGCPEDQVSVAEIGGTSYRAVGCDQAAVYNCSGSDSYKGTTNNYTCIPEAPPAPPPTAVPPAAAPKAPPAPSVAPAS